MSGEDLVLVLRRARSGDRTALACLYDQTCDDAWLLARCAAPDEDAARASVLQAYHELVLIRWDDLETSSPRAQLLALVHAHARAA